MPFQNFDLIRDSLRKPLADCRGNELLLPLEDACPGGGGLGLLNVAGVLESDGEGGMGQRILGGEDG